MKKKIVLLSIILFAVYLNNVFAFTVPDIEGYDMFYQNTSDIVSGGFSLNPVDIFNNIVNMIFSEVKAFSGQAAILLVMAMLSSAVCNLDNSLGENAGGKAAFFTFFIVISGIAVSCFNSALSYGVQVTGHMTSFMNKLTPVLMLMLFTCCKSVSAAAFEPVLSAAVFVVSVAIEKCLVPLMTFSAVLAVAGNVGDKPRISGFVKIIKSISKWVMAFIITLFTGINAVYGFTASSLDAVGAKTIKFAVGSLVPVVGGFLSDTLDTVASSTGLLKNAAGVSGIIIMAGICITPIIKIGVMQLILKLVAAITEPICDKRISGMIWDVSEAITAVFGMVVLTSVLFLINICIILTATN